MTTIAAQPRTAPAAGHTGTRPRTQRPTTSLIANLMLARNAASRRAGYALVALLAAAFFLMYIRWFDKQFGPGGEIMGIDFGSGSYSANRFQDWGHAYFIPIISIAYIYVRRHTIDLTRAATYWPAIAPAALGVLVYVVFAAVRPTHMLQGFGMLLTLACTVLLLFGPYIFRRVLFPVAYLALGITIAEQVMLMITFPLKQLAAQGGHLMLAIIGIDHRLQGNVLHVFDASGNEFPLDVAEACSGMRMVVAFVALSVAVAFFSCRQWWQRAAVMLVAVPVALFMNIVRVAALAALTLQDPDLAVGGAHTFIGTLLLVPAFLMFMGFVWVFKKATPDDEPETATP
jgi:exosortase